MSPSQMPRIAEPAGLAISGLSLGESAVVDEDGDDGQKQRDEEKLERSEGDGSGPDGETSKRRGARTSGAVARQTKQSESVPGRLGSAFRVRVFARNANASALRESCVMHN